MSSIIEELERQVKEEIGDAELTPEQMQLIQQKYGLMIPQRIPIRLIRPLDSKEETNGRKR